MTSDPRPQAGKKVTSDLDVLEEVAASVAAALVETGTMPELARTLAERCAERVRRHFGGQFVYFPTGYRRNLERRNAEIRRRLAAGEDRAAIRREFELSDMQLRRIETGKTLSGL